MRHSFRQGLLSLIAASPALAQNPATQPPVQAPTASPVPSQAPAARVELRFESWNHRPVVAENAAIEIVATIRGASVHQATLSGPSGQVLNPVDLTAQSVRWRIEDAQHAGDLRPDQGRWTADLRTTSGPIQKAFLLDVVAWEPLKIGAGGFVSGVDGADDDTILFRTDTSGAYLWDPDSRTFVDLVGNIDEALFEPYERQGTFEALVADQNSDRIYLWQEIGYEQGHLLRSDDRGASFQVLQSGYRFHANGGSMRTMNQHADVDPRDENHLLFGDQLGVFRSVDGGDTVHPVTSVPAPVAADAGQRGVTGVKFSRFGPAIGGRSAHAMLNTGRGFFFSDDGAATFRDVTSPMARHRDRHSFQGEWLSDGTYITQFSNTIILRFDPVTEQWTELLNDANWSGILHFRADMSPDFITRSRYAVVAHSRSSDGGASWQGGVWSRGDTVADQGLIPWHNSSDGHGYLHNDSFTTSSGRVWLAGGNRGIAYAQFSELWQSVGTNQALDVTTVGAGVEQICPTKFRHAPGTEELFTGFWDETLGVLSADNSGYPAVISDQGNGFGASWGVAISPQDPQFWAAVPSWDGDDVATGGWYSVDGWRTRTQFLSPPAPYPSGNFIGADLAVTGRPLGAHGLLVAHGGTDDDCLVLASQDLGATWAPSYFGAPVEGPLSRVRRTFFLDRHVIAADPGTEGVFWLYSHDDIPQGSRGLWRSSDFGSTFELVRSGSPPAGSDGSWYYNAQLEVPVAGEPWLIAGSQSPASTPDTSLGILHSSDGGQSFRRLPRVTEPEKIAFGAPAPGSSYPALYFAGWVDLEFGVWMTPNPDATDPTYIRLGRFANDNAVGLRHMAAHQDRYGVVYVAHGCAGASYGDFSALLR